jgi:hypothetical protein
LLPNALVTLICVLCPLRTKISPSICNSVLSDLEASKAFSREFKRCNSTNDVDFEATVIHSGYWPYKNEAMKGAWPDAAQALTGKFERW